MKQRAKKTAADEKVERKKTGGGAFTSKLNGTDEQILAVLGNRAKPLTNQFDSDALYHSEHGSLNFCCCRVCLVILIVSKFNLQTEVETDQNYTMFSI